MAFAFNPFTGTFDYFEKAATTGGGSAVAPYQLDSAETLTVPNKQVLLASETFVVDGLVTIDGILVEV